jgi:hypothetical protein
MTSNTARQTGAQLYLHVGRLGGAVAGGALDVLLLPVTAFRITRAIVSIASTTPCIPIIVPNGGKIEKNQRRFSCFF